MKEDGPTEGPTDRQPNREMKGRTAMQRREDAKDDSMDIILYSTMLNSFIKVELQLVK